MSIRAVLNSAASSGSLARSSPASAAVLASRSTASANARQRQRFAERREISPAAASPRQPSQRLAEVSSRGDRGLHGFELTEARRVPRPGARRAVRPAPAAGRARRRRGRRGCGVSRGVAQLVATQASPAGADASRWTVTSSCEPPSASSNRAARRVPALPHRHRQVLVDSRAHQRVDEPQGLVALDEPLGHQRPDRLGAGIGGPGRPGGPRARSSPRCRARRPRAPPPGRRRASARAGAVPSGRPCPVSAGAGVVRPRRCPPMPSAARLASRA